jgi:hypothetical protein
MPPPRGNVPVRVRVEEALQFAAPTTATERKWTRHAVAIEARR